MKASVSRRARATLSYVLAACMAVGALLSGTALSQTIPDEPLKPGNRMVIWDPVPGAMRYLGNIYYRDGRIIPIITLNTYYQIPFKAAFEVTAILSDSSYKHVLISYASDSKNIIKGPLQKQPAPPLPKKGASTESPPATNGNSNLNQDSGYEVFDYGTPPATDPIIDDAPMEDFFVSAPKSAKGSNHSQSQNISGTWGLGAIALQESLLSQGLVGVFDGLGASYGLESFVDIFPQERQKSDIGFTFGLSTAQFESDSETHIGDQETKYVTNRNVTLRLRAETHLLVAASDRDRLYLGLGGIYQRLPFFEVNDEALGTGSLVSRTSLGFGLLMRYRRDLSQGAIIADIRLIPVGASVKSITQTDFAVTLRSGIDLGYFVTLHSRYQKIRYPRECAATDTNICLSPKSEGYSIGPSFGLYWDY